MGNGQFVDYNVDIVMCIDGTGSMGRFIQNVKDKALSLYKIFVDEMEKKEKSVEQLRIKVMVFRDYKADVDAIQESEFFILPQQEEELANYVNSIEAVGGGDIPENSLEAIALAMRSDWVRTGSKRRHVIMLWTDAPALELGARKDCPNYPADLPASYEELNEIWEGQEMELKAKRLILFAPDAEPWNEMQFWTNTIHQPSEAGAGCSEAELDVCIRLLVNSL